jgi:hypothetical protein
MQKERAVTWAELGKDGQALFEQMVADPKLAQVEWAQKPPAEQWAHLSETVEQRIMVAGDGIEVLVRRLDDPGYRTQHVRFSRKARACVQRKGRYHKEPNGNLRRQGEDVLLSFDGTLPADFADVVMVGG